MNSEAGFYETDLYRCLVYQEKETDDIYLSLCGFERCISGYEYHTEDREGYHLHVILAGKGILSVNGSLVPLHRGQMFVTKPGEKTWYRADIHEPWTYCWMTFDGINAEEYAVRAGFGRGVNWRDCRSDQSEFYALVKQVLDRPEMTRSNSLRRLGLLLEYLSLAIQSNEDSSAPRMREQRYSSDVYVDYAVGYIQSNYASARIGDIARNIGINRSYLTGIFKQKMGVSPQEYLMQCRLDHACSLLTETDAPIQDISRRTGYENPLTFSKIFKSCFGVSPKKYREQRRDGKEKE